MAVDTLARAIAAGKVPVDAYEMAVAGGYTGTKEEFEADMGNSGTNATNAANSAAAAATSETAALAAATNFAPAYSSSATYAVGDYVLYEGGLYECNTAITTAEAWTAAHWTAKKIAPEVADLKAQMDTLIPIDLAEGVTVTNGQYINYSTGETGSSTNAFRTGFIDISAYSKIVYSRYYATSTTSQWGIAFYTSASVSSFIEGSGIRAVLGSSVAHYELESADVPEGANYVRLSGNQTLGPVKLYNKADYDRKVYPRIDQLSKNLNSVENDITEINSVLRNESLSTTEAMSITGLYLGTQQDIGQTPVISNNSNGKIAIVDIAYAAGGVIELEMDTVTSNDNTVSMFCDADNKIVYVANTSNTWLPTFDSEKNRYVGQKAIPSDATWLYFSVYKGSDTLYLNITPKFLGNTPTVYYVSADGNDNNDGRTAEAPKATVTSAIKSGAKTVLVSGGKYYQSVDFDGIEGNIKIAPATPDGLPEFYAPDALITDSETAVPGYTKVYSAPCSKTFDSKIVWIFQDDVPDASTEITTSERHPLQRGKQYRCGDTKIVKCSSESVSDALAEIESASAYKWFHDSANSIIYFSRPQAVTEINPIMASFINTFLKNKTRKLSLEIVGISVKYQFVSLLGLASAILSDCSCVNCCAAGAYRWDRGVSIKLYRCEAARTCFGTSAGDGFNAHSENTGDAFAHQTSCILFDCWSHDNVDDGYSDHERCEITLYGGLYEHNGGGGVTPAIGSHCTCYNVLSRYNDEADFFYSGNPVSSEGGVGGQIACYGCVSIGKGSGRGFRLNGSEIQGLFYNCICIDRDTGFFSESNGGTQVGTLINCSTSGCTTPRSEIFTVINGTQLT